MPRIKFSPEESEAQDAIVVSFDLSGSSDFCSRSDAHVILPKFLSRLFDELNGFLMEGWEMALENLRELVGVGSERRKVVKPEFLKFIGDGALDLMADGPRRSLYLWVEKNGVVAVHFSAGCPDRQSRRNVLACGGVYVPIHRMNTN